LTALSSEQRSFDILLVEDNRADIILLKKAFESAQLSHRIHVVMNGDDAISFLRRGEGYQDAPRPALILLDLNLPGKDGREVLEEIKQDDALRGIPVVVLTSSHSENDVVHCYDLHANAVMTKVADFVELVELTKSVCGYWLSAVRLPPR
jgi:CheY-like chemotaxis protein